MPVPWLTVERLGEVHAAAVRARVAPDAGLGPEFAATIAKSEHQSDSARLLAHLLEMNRIDYIADGTVPLRSWLEAARNQTRSRLEEKTFAAALADIGVSIPGPVSPAPSGRRHKRIWIALAALGAGSLAALGTWIAMRTTDDLAPGRYSCSVEGRPLRVCEVTRSSTGLRLLFEPISKGKLINRYTGDLLSCGRRGCWVVQLKHYYEDGSDVQEDDGGTIVLEQRDSEVSGTWTQDQFNRRFALRSAGL